MDARMRKVYSFFILATFSSSLLSMDGQYRHQLVKDIMVRNIKYLSHGSICALVLVDKNYNQLIQETVEVRKNYLRMRAKYYNRTIHNTLELRKNYFNSYGLTCSKLTRDAEVTWHKYGSAYVLLGKNKEHGSKNLIFKIAYLMDGDVCDAGKTVELSDELDDKCHFNRQGEVYFRGIQSVYRAVTIDIIEHSSDIIEYSLSFQHPFKQHYCFIELENLTYWRLGCLLDFPALLQAFFESTQVCEKLITTRCMRHCTTGERREIEEQVKVYNIKEVTIPDDFRVSKESLQVFDQLPESLRNAILDKYAEQQR